MLAKLQLWFFSRGAAKEDYCLWDRFGNIIQDIRTNINTRIVTNKKV